MEPDLLTRNGFSIGMVGPISKGRRFQPGEIIVCHFNGPFDHWTFWGAQWRLFVSKEKSVASLVIRPLSLSLSWLSISCVQNVGTQIAKIPLNRNPVPFGPLAGFVCATA